MCALALEQKLFPAKRYYLITWICVLSVCAMLSWKQAGVWRDEKSLYTQMLKVSPRSLEAMIGLAGAYYLEKNYTMSSLYAWQAIERDYTDYRPYMTLGNINFVQNRLNDALQLFLEAQNKNPLSPEVLNSLGSVYDDLGSPQEAIDIFKAALKLRPDYFEANTNLGVTLERTENLSAAESALNQALAANGDYVPAWFNLGVVRYKKNDKQGARLAFYEAVKRDPSHIDALTNLSVVCREIGDEACYKDATTRMDMMSSANKLRKR